MSLSHAQAAILLVLGLQRRGVDEAGEALGGLPGTQVLALFSKALRKLHGSLKASREAELERTLPKVGRPRFPSGWDGLPPLPAPHTLVRRSGHDLSG